MVKKIHIPVLAAACMLAFAPAAFAASDAPAFLSMAFDITPNTTTKTNTNTTSLTGSLKIDEMIAKYRAMLEQKRGTSTSSSKIKTAWAKGISIANVDASCVQKAVDTREVALQSAFNKSNASIMDALKARQTALYAAWGKEVVSERNVALKDAWKAWTDARKLTAKTLKSERDSAWSTFRTTVKDTCKVSVPTEDASAGSDTAGQTAI